MKPLLKIDSLSFRYGDKIALRNINLEIYEGETIGLVGESGSGKTTLARLIIAILKPVEGELYYNGKAYSTYSKKDLQLFRKEVQMVFQDPYSSLNPRMTIEEIVGEPLFITKTCKRTLIKEQVIEMLSLVGLTNEFISRYPHELSGGQRQRVAIARALILRPKFLILDEPIAALDVSIQAQIINLLKNLQKTLGLTYLFISHDLSIIKYLSTRVAVMYLGEIVETATSDEIYKNPTHEYTKTLLASIPKLQFVSSGSEA